MQARKAADTVEYRVRCFHCTNGFDAMQARWCHCGHSLRTLVCPLCERCFCAAPMPFKRRFWDAAPRELAREPRRFGSTVPAASLAVVERRATPEAPLVLIVDDDEAFRSLISCVVGNLGYRTAVAHSPVVGLQMAQSPEVKVVVTDALMPEMDGRELCRRIKEDDATRTKKVIVMTSLYTARRYREEAFKDFGADEYLSKPVDFIALSDALARFAPM